MASTGIVLLSATIVSKKDHPPPLFHPFVESFSVMKIVAFECSARCCASCIEKKTVPGWKICDTCDEFF